MKTCAWCGEEANTTGNGVCKPCLANALERTQEADEAENLVGIPEPGKMADHLASRGFTSCADAEANGWTITDHEGTRVAVDALLSDQIATPKAVNVGGRPRLQSGEQSIRVGFTITKGQWLALTDRARRDGVSFSEIVRRALDLLEKWGAMCLLLGLLSCGSDPARPGSETPPAEVAQTTQVPASPAPVAEDSVEPRKTMMIADSSKLPVCDPSGEGWLFYLKAEAQFRVCSDNVWSVIDLAGAKGPAGADGEDGLAGSTGQTGSQGANGPNGSDATNETNLWVDPVSGGKWLVGGHGLWHYAFATCVGSWRMPERTESELAVLHGLWSALGFGKPAAYDLMWLAAPDTQQSVEKALHMTDINLSSVNHATNEDIGVYCIAK